MKKILHYIYVDSRGMEKYEITRSKDFSKRALLRKKFGAKQNLSTERPAFPLQSCTFLLKISNVCLKCIHNSKDNNSKHPNDR